MEEENVSVSSYIDCPHSLDLLSRTVLLGLRGRRLPAGLHQHRQPVLLQPALARHRTSVCVLPPVDLDGY